VTTATSREVALDVLQGLDGGTAAAVPPVLSAAALLDQEFKRGFLSRPERALATEMVYGVLRQRNWLDWCIQQFSNRPVAEISPLVLQILRIAAYQIMMLDKIPPSAAVHEAVNLVKRRSPGKMQAASGFVNAVLRSLDRGKEGIRPPDPAADPIRAISIETSHPVWLVRRWADRYGLEPTRNLCRLNNELPPLTLRVNTLFMSRDAFLDVVKEKGVSAGPCRFSRDGVRVLGRTPILDLPGYGEGWFYVQDEGAQLVSLALAPRPGEAVLDACAAPGGKTTHIAALMEDTGQVVAIDPHSARLSLIADNRERLNLHNIKIQLGDMVHGPFPPEGELFDRILLDVPCSGLGVLRRHPEGRWRKGPELIAYYQDVQRKILDRAAPYLKAGGFMLYSTCSTEREETEDRVEEFLSRHAEFEKVPLQTCLPEAAPLIDASGFLNTTFSGELMDGFFAAGLRKRVPAVSPPPPEEKITAETP
jgi:16S rRNA (cytosine967-C5)-methyltransferase